MRLGRRADADADLAALPERVEALGRFVAAVDDVVPADSPVAADVAAARGVVDRAGQRLALSREHTVVALAGGTGSGKSSLFNALTGHDFSPVGLIRPTTGEPYACVWGAGDASALLDWLGVPTGRRYRRESALDGSDPQLSALGGLVLLDLPDFDSVEEAHRVEVDRLLELVDLMVWVLDPQKYADRVVHTRYLAPLRHHRDVMTVLLHQADRLTPADLDRCLADLTRLLDADGLTGVPVLATSVADAGPAAGNGLTPGDRLTSGDGLTFGDGLTAGNRRVGAPSLAGLRERLAEVVAARRAALRRLAGDVDHAVAELAGLVAADAPDVSVDDRTHRQVVAALAEAAGVPAAAGAVRRGYRHRAHAVTGQPLVRWVRHFRRDPLRRLRLGTPSTGEPAGPVDESPVLVTGPTALPEPSGLPAASPATSAAVGLALRTVGERAGAGLPDPWPQAALAAARSRRDELAAALDIAVARTDLGVPGKRWWWRVIGLFQWLATAAIVAGVLWLLVRYALFAIALPEPPMPEVGRLPLPTALLIGGVLGAVVFSFVARLLVRAAAARAARRASARLTRAVTAVADEYVVGPVTDLLRRYGDARAALRAAGRR
ncbi:GTPase [Luedemannella helvata]|uniref:50S ribosome-binding GTPase n=1 Tax=Luedemannella helvata TaxID=349315 RepID=A0ABP4WKG9_9ACTN